MTGNGADDGDGGGEGDESRIRQLDRRTIDRIAAGEVVERPASAVKELLENALDADAARVSVAVESGGIDGIRVTDDGIGMGETDVRRAIEKHTTSKIESIEDLERGVGSLGFRGEALAAIAAVSRLAVRTKPRGGTRGTELVVRGGEVESVSPTGCPAGTVVEVSDLFYNVPARKKYLKQETTEFAHVTRVITGYALANPDIAVSLEHDGRETFATSGSGDLREAVLSTYGRAVARAMIPLDGDDDDGGGDGDGDEGGGDRDEAGDTEGPIESIGGLVSDPETTRANASYVTTIVNGRYVTAKALREAILDAYGKQLAPDRYPFAVLTVELPPEKLDVNVHPRKLEVRFEDERSVKESVERRVERALLREGLVRSGAPRGRSAPTQTRIDPGGQDADTGPRRAESSGSEPPERDTATSRADDREDENRAAGSGDGAPAASETSATGRAGGRADGDKPENGAIDGNDRKRPSRSNRSDAEQACGDRESDSSDRGPRDRDPVPGSDRKEPEDASGRQGGSEPPRLGTDGARAAVDLEGVVDPHAHIDERAARSGRATGFAASEQRALSGKAIDDSREFDRLPSLRVLGQLNGTYVVCETADGLVLVDQHAADERVTYERLRERLPRGEAQTLAEPVEIELTAGEAALFDSHIDTLAGLGFYASWAADDGGSDDSATENGQSENGRIVEVRTVPAAIGDPDPALLCDVLAAFVSADRPGRTIDAAADALLADLACYPSITANTSLSAGSMVDLLEELDSCENPYACPHGRPVVIEVGRGEIEARFERDYPGHAGRRSE